MRTDTPRLPPLTDSELNPEQGAVMANLRGTSGDTNIVRTFVRHPALLKAYNVWASHSFSQSNALSKRDSELVTMRTLWQCKAGYQWSRHVPMGLQAGLTQAEIAALKQPVAAGSWNERDAVLLQCVDMLVAECFIGDDLWGRLCGHFSELECIDAIFLCGRYVMAAMFVNTAGTPIDPDVRLDPDFDLRG